MTNELLNEWKKEKIVEDGDIVLAGVSGGADSVCLLLMLEQLQKKTDFLLEAVHVEHGIRGEESRKDAAFVKNLCQDHGIRCHIFSVEVPLLRFLPLSYNSHILKCALLPPSQDHVSPQIQELPLKRRSGLRWRIMRRITQKRFCFRWCAEADWMGCVA